jgi:hypothetical protein
MLTNNIALLYCNRKCYSKAGLLPIIYCNNYEQCGVLSRITRRYLVHCVATHIDLTGYVYLFSSLCCHAYFPGLLCGIVYLLFWFVKSLCILI